MAAQISVVGAVAKFLVLAADLNPILKWARRRLRAPRQPLTAGAPGLPLARRAIPISRTASPGSGAALGRAFGRSLFR